MTKRIRGHSRNPCHRCCSRKPNIDGDSDGEGITAGPAYPDEGALHTLARGIVGIEVEKETAGKVDCSEEAKTLTDEKTG